MHACMFVGCVGQDWVGEAWCWRFVLVENESDMFVCVILVPIYIFLIPMHFAYGSISKMCIRM